MSGFAAMGMEILWFRHLTILLGGFRAVFSLLLTIILIGIGGGSLASSFLNRRTSRPGTWLMVGQALFVASALLGLAITDSRHIDAAVTANPAYRAALGGSADSTLPEQSGLARALGELWFNGRPMLFELAIPALLMGLTFPLANAVIQQAEQSVGRRAGVLYLSNTAGAVCGSLAAGFLLLPALGIQGSATVLMLVGALAIVPLAMATREKRAAVGSMLIAGAALVVWALLPSDYVIARALARSDDSERRLTMHEGLTEVVEVTERPGVGRRLLTNGHPMSATTPIVAALHACAGPHSASRHREPRDRARDRLRGRQHHARRDAPSVNPARRGGGSLQGHPRFVRLLQRGEWRRAARPARGGVRQRRAAASADAAAGLVRSDHAGAAADRLCRRGSAVFERVLRAGAHASQAAWLRQPVAAGVPGSRGDHAGDDSRLHRRVPAGGVDLGR